MTWSQKNIHNIYDCDQILLLLPEKVDLRWVGNGRAEGDEPWAMAIGNINPDFVQILSMSNDCPMSVKFQFFSKFQNINPEHFIFKSKVCQETVQRGKMQYLELYWIEF